MITCDLLKLRTFSFGLGNDRLLSFFPSKELEKPVVLILLLRLKISNRQNTLKSEGAPKIYEIETAIYVRSVGYKLRGGGVTSL